MKLVNYQLQTQIETLSDTKSKKFFKEYLQNILEDELKPYYQKADYVGLSLNELKNKIDYIANDIKELQNLKKQLTESLDIAKVITAEVFNKNGIDRIDGGIISSITLSKETSKVKETLTITDEKAVMGLGHVQFEPDTESILKAMKTKEGQEELSKFVSISSDTIITPAKVKINTKRTSVNTDTEEILAIEKKVA